MPYMAVGGLHVAHIYNFDKVPHNECIIILYTDIVSPKLVHRMNIFVAQGSHREMTIEFPDISKA